MAAGVDQRPVQVGRRPPCHAASRPRPDPRRRPGGPVRRTSTPGRAPPRPARRDGRPAAAGAGDRDGRARGPGSSTGPGAAAPGSSPRRPGLTKLTESIPYRARIASTAAQPAKRHRAGPTRPAAGALRAQPGRHRVEPGADRVEELRRRRPRSANSAIELRAVEVVRADQSRFSTVRDTSPDTVEFRQADGDQEVVPGAERAHAVARDRPAPPGRRRTAGRPRAAPRPAPP